MGQKLQHKKIDTRSDVSMYGHQKKQAIPRKLASRKIPLEILCEWAEAVMDEETGELF